MASPIPPKKKGNSRTLLLVGVGALALMFLLMRRQQAAQAQDPNASALAPGQPASTPSTFADNGGQAANLGDSISTALGNQSTTIASALSQQSQDITGALAQINQNTAPMTTGDQISSQLTAEAALITALAAAARPATAGAQPQGKGKKKKPTKTQEIVRTVGHSGTGPKMTGHPTPQIKVRGHKQNSSAANRVMTKNPRR